MSYKDSVSESTVSTAFPLTLSGHATEGNRTFFNAYGTDAASLSLIMRQRVSPFRWMTFTGSYTNSDNKIAFNSFRASSDGVQITSFTGTWDVFVSVLSDELNANFYATVHSHTLRGNNTTQPSAVLDLSTGDVITLLDLHATNIVDFTSTVNSEITAQTAPAYTLHGNKESSNHTFENLNVTDVKTLLAYSTSDITGLATYVTNTVSAQTAESATSVAYSTTINLDLQSSTLPRYFYTTFTGSSATSIAVINPPTSGTVGSFTLELTNPGLCAITWTNGKWAGGTAPTFTTTGTDIIVGFTRNAGTTIRYSLSEKDSK